MKIDNALEIIHTIYQRPDSPEHWNKVLSDISEALELDSVSIMEVSLPGITTRTTRSVGVDEESNRLYDEYYCLVNPIVKNAAPTLDLGSLVDGIRLIGRDTWTRSEFYNDFSKPNGIYWVAGTVLFFTPALATSLSTHRSQRAGPFSEDDLRLMELITPHLGNRIELERRLVSAEKSLKTFERAVEALGVACVVLDERATAIYCNRPAEELLASRDGLALSAQGNLVARDALAAPALRRMLREAMAISAIRGVRRPAAVQVERPSGRQPYTVFAYPCDPGDPVLEREPTVLVLINDPDARSPSLPELLTRLYGLTPAEARVALELLAGKSPKEIAGEFGLAVDTVRTQVKNVLSKTGTRRQSEFVAVVFRSLGGWMR